MAGIPDRHVRGDGVERTGDGPLSVPTLTRPFAVLAFWGAIVLPALYLPPLAAGLGTTDDLAVFPGLFALHVAGRPHSPG